MEDEKLKFKSTLKAYCVRLLEERLENVEQLILSAQESANNESKSSAGDKYETSRAMGHLQKEMYQQQAVKIRHELLKANATEIKLHPNVVKKGTLIIAGERGELRIFICAGLGKKVVDDLTVLFVSDEAPLYNLLCKKAVGELLIIDKHEQPIREIW